MVSLMLIGNITEIHFSVAGQLIWSAMFQSPAMHIEMPFNINMVQLRGHSTSLEVTYDAIPKITANYRCYESLNLRRLLSNGNGCLLWPEGHGAKMYDDIN